MKPAKRADLARFARRANVPESTEDRLRKELAARRTVYSLTLAAHRLERTLRKAEATALRSIPRLHASAGGHRRARNEARTTFELARRAQELWFELPARRRSQREVCRRLAKESGRNFEAVRSRLRPHWSKIAPSA